MNTQETYTVPELAELWHCSIDIVYDLLRRGELQGFRLGGRSWRISNTARLAFENRSAIVAHPMPSRKCSTLRIQ